MVNLLTSSKYQPHRGGHAPGDIREAFGDALDAYNDWTSGLPEPQVELRDRMVPISRIAGLLWNCNDVLPAMLWSTLCDVGADHPINGIADRRRTYAVAARWLHREIALDPGHQVGPVNRNDLDVGCAP